MRLARWMLLLLPTLVCSCKHEDTATVSRPPPVPARMESPAPADEFAARRAALVEGLRREGIGSEHVLAAMLETERHRFVPDDQVRYAYEDRALPIGDDQTISQPYVVAFMTWKLDPKPSDKVLEIGTGSGYQAAVLSPLVDHVYTIEILESLGTQATERLAELGYGNVTVRVGDGYQGWPEHAPFDKIIVTCAPDEPPQPLIDQLKEGGRMVIPYGRTDWTQELYVLEKRDGEIERKAVLPVQFVPMTGEAEER